MVSISNTAANSAVLANIRKINKDITTTQTRIGTGLKINSASDNAAVWKTAQGIRSDISAQDNLSSGIATFKGKADTAVAALDTIVSLLGDIQEIADEVGTGGTATTDQVNSVTAIQKQIAAVISSANFGGENWLTAGSTSETVNISYADSAAVTLSLTTVDVDADTGYIAAAVTAATTATLANYIGYVDTAVATLTAYSATLSGYSNSLETQQDFLSSLKSIRETAVDSLVNADLEEESAKLTALQVSQQLAYQALSMGNSSSQNVLLLFQ